MKIRTIVKLDLLCALIVVFFGVGLVLIIILSMVEQVIRFINKSLNEFDYYHLLVVIHVLALL